VVSDKALNISPIEQLFLHYSSDSQETETPDSAIPTQVEPAIKNRRAVVPIVLNFDLGYFVLPILIINIFVFI
jgi:hypothetical protein